MILHHRVEGPPGAPPLLLGPSLGTSTAVWDPQLPALARGHRVVRWGLPGHRGGQEGRAPGAEPAPATVAALAGLVLELADRLGLDRFRYAGISLGGAVGAWLAAHRPDRVEALALVCTSAHFGGPGPWLERAALVRDEGMDPVADAAPARWFTPTFADRPAARARVADLRGADPDRYAALCEALAAFDLRADLARIAAPTLVVAGRGDPAAPPGHARELADGIPGAGLTEIPHASHLANVERPAPVLAALLGHFGAPPGGTAHARSAVGEPGDAERHAAGTAVRRAVLGDAHVDGAAARTTAFTAGFQDFLTRYAWGEVWTRPGLDRATRSCVTLTALVAGGRTEELAMHVRAALRNGLTAGEIEEVLLQSAVYCGLPAANAAFAVADRVLAETGASEAASEESDGPPESGAAERPARPVEPEEGGT